MSMLNLAILVNENNEDEKALVDLDDKRVCISGDYYHDKIDEQIEGFLEGLKFANVKYELVNDWMEVSPEDELFEVAGFIQY